MCLAPHMASPIVPSKVFVSAPGDTRAPANNTAATATVETIRPIPLPMYITLPPCDDELNPPALGTTHIVLKKLSQVKEATFPAWRSWSASDCAVAQRPDPFHPGFHEVAVSEVLRWGSCKP